MSRACQNRVHKKVPGEGGFCQNGRRGRVLKIVCGVVARQAAVFSSAWFRKLRRIGSNHVSVLLPVLPPTEFARCALMECQNVQEKSDLAYTANVIGYRRAFFCDKVR